MVKLEDQKRQWTCEFCQQVNQIQLEDEELPTSGDVTYLVENHQQLCAKQVKEGSEEEKAQDNDVSIIFCLDNSGSMGVTSQLSHPVQLKHGSAKNSELEYLKQFMEPQEYEQIKQQYKFNDMQQYVSRKVCVQAAIESQLEQEKAAHPGRRIGLVVFGDDVCIVGDGSPEPLTVAGDKLQNFDYCYEIGKSAWLTHMAQPISASYDSVLQKFQGLEEKGKTALGPALCCSLGMLSQARPGSMVIMCTDGLANVGFGSMDSVESEKPVSEVYGKMSVLAKEKGTLISAITLKGEECNVMQLGKLALSTNGKIARVNPETIQEEFASAFKEEVIATDVVVHLHLHEDLQFVNVDAASFKDKEDNKLVQEFGSVTKKKKVTIGYQIKNYEQLMKKFIESHDKDKKLPYQALIYYTNKAGDRMVRVITQTQSIAQEQREAEENVNLDILYDHVQESSVKEALFGDVRCASKKMIDWDNYLQEISHDEQQQQDQSRSNQLKQVKMAISAKLERNEAGQKQNKKKEDKPQEQIKEENIEEDEANQGLFDLI